MQVAEWSANSVGSDGNSHGAGYETKWIKILGDATVDPVDKDAKSGGPLDVDSVTPFAMDKVMATLQPALCIAGWSVKEETTTRVECKRPRNSTSYEGNFCGESVTAVLEAQGNQTRIRVMTESLRKHRAPPENAPAFLSRTELNRTKLLTALRMSIILPISMSA